MDYEIAKQLKDAGFPQKEHELSARDIGEWPRSEAPYLWPYNPTLEELIEACGDVFSTFAKNASNDGWVAFTFSAVGKHASGSTPTEAVASLWLALNKKTI